MPDTPRPHVTVDDDSAVARLTARLIQLDFDAPTLELLLAALTADECDPFVGAAK